jgi:N-methylhydantoinase B
MIDRHGMDAVMNYGRALLDYAQFFMSKTIGGIPNGQYRFEDAMDDDGAGNGPVPITAVIRIEGDRAVVDLTGSADQVAGCINCPPAVARSAVYYCFACLLDERVPLNGGSFRNIECLTRPGSVVHAVYPAAVVAGNTEISQRMVDVVFGALAQALPDKIPAASCGTMSSVALGGEGWTYYETIGGGSGAGPDADGASCVQCHMTNTLNTPAEALELQYPLRVRRFERAENTGGDGQHRGGDGIIRAIEALQDCTGTLLGDRRRISPYGLAGGAKGKRGKDGIIKSVVSSETIWSTGKVQFSLNRGDVLSVRTPGGGAWGEAHRMND